MIRSFGVEEELLLVSSDGRPAPAADRVVDLAPRDLETEFKKEQTEFGSDPCSDTGALEGQLRSLRATASAAAGSAGARVVALATSPLKVRPTVTDDERYRRMTEEFGLLADQLLTCGQHVHVQIRSPEEGVAVLDRIGVWLPTILAVSANSPFWQGQDTGYASFRSMLWGRWPTAVSTAPFGDPTTYDAVRAELISSGAALDDAMIYFDARLSVKYPTLEIRVPDVCLDVSDAVLIAALCRGLVDTSAEAWRRGDPAPAVRPELMRAAQWRAARRGLTDQLVDLADRRPIPAAAALDRLLAHVQGALTTNGDLDCVQEGLRRLLNAGTGAQRQRGAYRARGTLSDVVDDAVARTLM